MIGPLSHTLVLGQVVAIHRIDHKAVERDEQVKGNMRLLLI